MARSLPVALLKSLRPEQWTKNVLVFAPLIFAEKLFDPHAVGIASAAFAIFCVLSSVVYLVNDIADREHDRQHPIKRLRPIAAGELPVGTATGVAIVLGAAAGGAAFLLGPRFGAVAVAYLALMVLYSGPLKQLLIIDVLTISIGFVLRALGGAVAIDVVITHWLFVCTILGALFISFGKRRHELVLLAGGATSHRRILGEYTEYLLDQMMVIVACATLISYIFYTISPETVAKFGTAALELTIPFPLYGIFRYLYLVHRREGGGSPADLLIKDRPLLLCVLLWVASAVLIIYGSRSLPWA
jgi:4-hydroxybenzoate polyprenyltransferase